MIPISFQRGARVALAALSALAMGCAGLQLSTPEGEAEVGSDLAAEVEQTVGLLEQPELQAYVASVGRRLIEASPQVRGDVDYAIAVVDTAAPNAFALPGGYIYVSRGLLALLNHEDELAAVIAHEIAHVSARHHLKHAVRSSPLVSPVRLVTGIGGAAVGIVFPRLGRAVAKLGSAPKALLLASHSRDQENEADALGQELAASAGWDPAAIARVMQTLAAEESLSGADPERKSFLATHPTSPERERLTLQNASTLERAAANGVPIPRERFLAKLDGLLVGARAEQGVAVGREFLHPELEFRIVFPEGWRISDDGASVRAVAPEEDASSTLTIAAKSDDPLAVAREVLRKASFEITSGPTAFSIGPRSAAKATGAVRGRDVQFQLELVWIAHGELVYQVVGGAVATSWPARSDALFEVPRSFRALRGTDLARVRQGRLRVVAARGGESLEEFLAARDSVWSAPQTAVANALEADAPLERGQPIKLGLFEPYVPPGRAD